MHPTRSPIAILFPLVALAALLTLGACGGDEGDGATTPYGSNPYAQTPYGQTTHGSGAGAKGGAFDADLRKRVDAALAKGRELLLSAQAENGGWGDPEIQVPPNVGYTAMAVAAVIGATPSTAVGGDASIRKALDLVASNQKEDGSIWDNPAYVNYATSASVGAFAAARIPAFRQNEVKARDFLAASQIAGDESDASYGGFPYKQDQGQAADLSNVQFALTALADAGLPKDHVVWQRAMTYLSRMQNRSESNSFEVPVVVEGEERIVKSGDDGGAFYLPGNSKAGLVKRADGTYEPVSYGSMTYALLKCLILAGADAEDPRVLAALGWIAENFTVAKNPGFEAATDAEVAGQQGYYYYVFTLARTLAEYEALTKKPLVVKDKGGNEHDWRAELARAILDRQREDGWWANEVSERWEEGAPVLATSYAVQALAELNGRYR